MQFSLSVKNVFSYLREAGICTESSVPPDNIEVKLAKNFNLLVEWKEGRSLLVKQEQQDRNGETANEFLKEWTFHQMLHRFPSDFKDSTNTSECLYFDPENSILVYEYLKEYADLDSFHRQKNLFPPKLAALLGTIVATLHRTTFNHQEYTDFIPHNSSEQPDTVSANHLARISPEIFGTVPSNCLKFFVLYQRYDSLGTAVSKLVANVRPSCVTHNDLKLNNVLLYNHWEQRSIQTPHQDIIRVIDWERCGWGDPAFDLGTLLANYLQLWLSSLVVDPSISIEESLRLSAVPLEMIQPSAAALIRAYLEVFPEILEQHPDFLARVVQFTGLALIQQIVGSIQYQKYFGNSSICLLQVAKSLLCRTEQSIPTIFGMAEAAVVG